MTKCRIRRNVYVCEGIPTYNICVIVRIHHVILHSLSIHNTRLCFQIAYAIIDDNKYANATRFRVLIIKCKKTTRSITAARLCARPDASSLQRYCIIIIIDFKTLSKSRDSKKITNIYFTDDFFRRLLL